jgi:hypothetical protein
MNILLNSNGVFRPEFKDNFMDRCDLTLLQKENLKK